jgi:hypothetical protein
MKPTERKKVWICGACGRTSDVRMNMKDASCYVWAVECWEDSIKRDERGIIIRADAVGEKGDQS